MNKTMLIDPVAYDGYTEKLTIATNQKTLLSSADRVQLRASFTDSVYSVVDGVAYINIVGILVATGDEFLRMFGMDHTGYDEIRRAVLQAEKDYSVSKIVFNVNTPGGELDGLDYTAVLLQNISKPTTGIIYGQACSAGYYLISQLDNVQAVTDGVNIGSIGVMVRYTKSDNETIVLRNDQSPEKNPNLNTDEGQALLVKELNKNYELFEQRIIEGMEGTKNFSIENVRSIKGGVVMAKEALELGLIDSIEMKHNITKESVMDLKEFLAQNETAKAEVDALVLAEKEKSDSAVESAVKSEASRIEGLLAISKVAISDTLKSAIAEGTTKESLAVKILEGAEPVVAPVVATNQVPPVTPVADLADDAKKVADKNEEYVKSLVAQFVPKRS